MKQSFQTLGYKQTLLTQIQMGGGVGGRWGYSKFFFIRRLEPSTYPSPPKNIRNFKHPKKTFEIFATKKKPLSVPWPQEKILKCIEMTPKYGPILWLPSKKYPQNIHTQKLFIFLKAQKILKLKISDPQKWTEHTYVWKFQSIPHPPTPGDPSTSKGDGYYSIVCYWPFLSNVSFENKRFSNMASRLQTWKKKEGKDRKSIQSSTTPDSGK